MADYFEELGHEPTGPNGPDDFHRHINRLRALAIMHGIDIEMPVPEASERAIKALPSHVLSKEDLDGEDDIECAICKMPGEIGDSYKVLPCKHEFHEECVLLWLKKANSCPLCRFELETDDEAYEELKRYQRDEPNRRQRVENLMDSMFS